MTSSSFESSKVVPCESTPLGRVSSGGGPVPQPKKKSSRSFFHVFVPILLVCLGITLYTRLSSSASPSSVVDQSVSKSVNKVNENDSIVFPTASLAASESKTSLRQVARGKWTIDKDIHCGGGTSSPLEDGTVYGWKPSSEGYTVAYCETKCEKSPSCTAFVWRHSDSGCFWKHSTSEKTTLAGHDCYSYDKDDDVVTPPADNIPFTPSTYYPEFPPGVYDSTLRNIESIGRNCNRFMATHKPSTDLRKVHYAQQALACRIFQDDNHPIVLGTIKTNSDIVKISSTGKFDANADVSSLFVDYALAAMIDRGCFEYQSEDNYHTFSTQYTSKTTYQYQMSKSASTDVSSSISFFGITASAGYQHSHSDASTLSGTRESAYGHKLQATQMGVLKNKCFDDQSIFDKNIKDLVKSEWVRCWSAMRTRGQYRTTVHDLLSLDCFPSVAAGGFYMPMNYYYGVGIENSISTSYTKGSSTEETEASNVITAGLGVDIDGVGGKFDSKVSNAMKTANSDSKFTSKVKHSSQSNFLKSGPGDYPGTTCTEAPAASKMCAQTISDEVDYIRNGYYTHLPSPTSQSKVSEMKTLDRILQLYFGDYGLPEKFLTAYSAYEYNRRGETVSVKQQLCQNNNPGINTVAVPISFCHNEGRRRNRSVVCGDDNCNRHFASELFVDSNTAEVSTGWLCCNVKLPVASKYQEVCEKNNPGRNVIASPISYCHHDSHGIVTCNTGSCNKYYGSTDFYDSNTAEVEVGHLCCISKTV